MVSIELWNTEVETIKTADYMACCMAAVQSP